MTFLPLLHRWTCLAMTIVIIGHMAHCAAYIVPSQPYEKEPVGTKLSGENQLDFSMFYGSSTWYLQQQVLTIKFWGTNNNIDSSLQYFGVYGTSLTISSKRSSPFLALVLLFVSLWGLVGTLSPPQRVVPFKLFLYMFICVLQEVFTVGFQTSMTFRKMFSVRLSVFLPLSSSPTPYFSLTLDVPLFPFNNLCHCVLSPSLENLP